MTTHCGYIAVVGRPNVGKSTLLNAILGKKFAVTSKRAQTTRFAMTFIYTSEQFQTQYLLVDTPGLMSEQKSDQHFTHRMYQEAISVMRSLDLRWWVLEAGHMHPRDELLLEILKPYADRTMVVLNKSDACQKVKILPQIERLSQNGFHNIIPCSALDRLSLDPLLKESQKMLPENTYFYPVDQHITYSEPFLVQEILREKLMRYVGQEIPYRCTIQTESFEHKDRLIAIAARIDVPHDRYKGILLGAKGLHMKEIAQAARRSLEAILEKQVFLKVWIKVVDGLVAPEEESRQAGSLGWTEEP